jgi:hypothetical protein
MSNREGILSRRRKKDRKRYFVGIMMRSSIQNVNKYLLPIPCLNIYRKRWQTFAFGLQSDKIPALPPWDCCDVR